MRLVKSNQRLEPYLRRRWPEAIISWNRLLAGKFRDPLIGRDDLVEATVGFYLREMLSQVVSTTDITAWFAQPSLIPIAAAVALLVYGFHISLAGRPVSGEAKLFDE